ncbi:hypothetical protein [Providencia manganoxydans]|uniref:hypothetical protein n=1 Tax=Providencia manganoxydans TaxID=2923283 RepID=UPI0034E3CD6C
MKRENKHSHVQEYKGFTIIRGYRSAVNPYPLYYVYYQEGHDELSLGGFYSTQTAKDYIDNLI